MVAYPVAYTIPELHYSTPVRYPERRIDSSVLKLSDFRSQDLINRGSVCPIQMSLLCHVGVIGIFRIHPSPVNRHYVINLSFKPNMN